MNLENLIFKAVKECLCEGKTNTGSSDYTYIGKTCVVRTYSAGVFVGKVTYEQGGEVVLNDCRRIWYWKGAASLSQMAVDGVSQPDQCKFSCVTQGHKALGVIELIPATDKAIKSIYGVKEWKS